MQNKRLPIILLLYAVFLTGVVWGLFEARSRALAELATTKATDDWQSWRDDVEQESKQPDAPVKRRVPKSTEPPWLVLMRDHFTAMLMAAVVFSSLLYGVLAAFAVGAWKENVNHTSNHAA